MRMRVIIDRIVVDGRDWSAAAAGALEAPLREALKAGLASRVAGLDAAQLQDWQRRRVVGSFPSDSRASLGDIGATLSASILDALGGAGLPAAPQAGIEPRAPGFKSMRGAP